MTLLMSISNIFGSEGEETRRFGIRTDLLERFLETWRQDWKAKLGSIVVLSVILLAVFAPVLAPYDPMAQKFPVFLPPDLTSAHPFGTDSFGRDLLSRVIYGARISLAVGIGAVTFGATLGILTGLIAGYFGGWIDDILMRIIDIIWAFPFLLLAIIFVTIFGQGVWNVIIAIGVAYIDDFARIARGEVLSIREEEYLLAAESIGMSDLSIIFEETFPNTIAPLLVEFTILVARAMLAEATLSFLGLGVKPTTPTWGSLIGQGRTFITSAWWISIIPGIMIMITVLGINLFGDALRDAFDVKEEGAA